MCYTIRVRQKLTSYIKAVSSWGFFYISDVYELIAVNKRHFPSRLLRFPLNKSSNDQIFHTKTEKRTKTDNRFVHQNFFLFSYPINHLTTTLDLSGDPFEGTGPLDWEPKTVTPPQPATTVKCCMHIDASVLTIIICEV